MSKRPKGKLIIIGGHEDKDKRGERAVLQEVARSVAGTGRLVIITAATQKPEEVAEEYLRVFRELGVKHIDVLDIRAREQAHDESSARKIEGAQAVLFTGGDQLRITSQIGDSPVFRLLQRGYEEGMTVAGTSAGAAAMPETMLVSGKGDESYEIDGLSMAAGLGLLPGVVIDSHFAQRGRLGRLLGAVAQNPKNLGIGIDEDTAIVVSRGERFQVIGSGGIYVVDGASISYSGLCEDRPRGVVTICDLKLHVLGAGQGFHLVERRPNISGETEKAERAGETEKAKKPGS